MAETDLITGVTGQDGALTAARLLAAGRRVVGVFRRGNRSAMWRLDELDLTDRITLIDADLADAAGLYAALAQWRPARVFHFAGASMVHDSFNHPRTALDVNLIGALNLLQAMKAAAPDARLFFPSSSEVFAPDAALCDETTPVVPLNPYGVSKAAAERLVEIWREHYGLTTYVGVLFNHEGRLRARNFVTRKISWNMARLKAEGGAPMNLGSFDAARDWSAAEDVVDAIIAMLDRAAPGRYVLGSGQASTVRDFIAHAAVAAGFDPVFEGADREERCVDRRSKLILACVSPKYVRKSDTPVRMADVRRFAAQVEQPPFRGVDWIAADMVRADLDRRAQGNVHV